MAKPIGILGGTFDPVHHGHLRLATEVRELLDLAEVRLIPVHTPAHRHQPLASGQHRLAMLRLAVRGTSGLSVDDREIIRGGISYTVDTLKSLHGENIAPSLCLIMGMDAFRTLNTWHEWNVIPEYAHIIVADREGAAVEFEHELIREFYSRRLCGDRSAIDKEAGKILKLNIPMLDISATRIRQLLLEGRDPGFLLPDSVIKYIKRESLYS